MIGFAVAVPVVVSALILAVAGVETKNRALEELHKGAKAPLPNNPIPVMEQR
jgi:hypothetical protein